MGADIRRLKQVRNRPLTKREKDRKAKICRRFRGAGPYNLRRLEAIQAKLVATLGVKVRARREGKRIELQKRESERLEKVGPKRWGSRPGEKEKLSGRQVKAMETYWKGVWQVVGTYDNRNAALKTWRTNTRVAGAPATGDDPLDREEAWKKALKKPLGWKAPGPDCLEAFWLRAFPGRYGCRGTKLRD